MANNHFKTIWNYLMLHKKLLFLALLLATINQIFSLLDPLIFRYIIDNYATKFMEMPKVVFIHGVLFLLLLAMGAALISRTAKNFQDYYVNVISQQTGTGLYSRSVEHVLNLEYSVFEDTRSGEVLQKLQKAKTDMQLMITSMINVIFLNMIGLVFILIYAFLTHWVIGLAFLLSIPIIGATTYFLSRRMKAAQKAVLAESTELAGTTTETLRNVEVVKSLGLEDQEIERLNSSSSKILNLELKKVRLLRKLSFFQGTLINTMRSILLFVMLWLIVEQQITLGSFFTLMIYSFFLFGPLSQFWEAASQYQEAKTSYEQLESILKIPPKKKPKNAKKVGKISDVTFRGVNFKYPSANIDSVANINLKLAKGKTVAFVGPSGSGKSTLVKLIVGLYEPTGGKVCVNSVESRLIDYDDFRKKIGLVSQETQLFAGTIRENLLFVKPGATDKEMMAAVTQAQAKAIIERGGHGLATKIGEGGIKISGGERQRIAIARALLRNPDLLIFDEATSSLDSITEKEITKTIKGIIKARPNTTIVLVAHRLSTISHADEIVVLEKGKIVESGNHDALIRKKGLYAALWREQTTS
jgi:ATP-binding cassette, subfamily B, bacterial